MGLPGRSIFRCHFARLLAVLDILFVIHRYRLKTGDDKYFQKLLSLKKREVKIPDCGDSLISDIIPRVDKMMI